MSTLLKPGTSRPGGIATGTIARPFGERVGTFARTRPLMVSRTDDRSGRAATAFFSASWKVLARSISPRPM